MHVIEQNRDHVAYPIRYGDLDVVGEEFVARNREAALEEYESGRAALWRHKRGGYFLDETGVSNAHVGALFIGRVDLRTGAIDVN